MLDFQILTVWLGAVAIAFFCAWGLYLLVRAITHTVARAWFAEKERHAKRIIEMSKED